MPRPTLLLWDTVTDCSDPEDPVGTEEDVDRAVKVGRKAFKTWSKMPISRRQELLKKFADALTQYEEELTTLLSTENGKPVGPPIHLRARSINGLTTCSAIWQTERSSPWRCRSAGMVS